MASTSSSKFDVFLSFRGEDTRHNFTDHLYHALLRAGLRTFRDDEAIPRGEALKPEIETAIIESRASIVVLSQNFANSKWCLDELCLMLEQRRKCGQFVLPIFYHIYPSDVRNQTGSFSLEESKETVDNVRRWKEALTEVANLTGKVLSSFKPETEFISQMVEIVQCRLDLKQLSTPARLTGMETRIEVINSWLRSEQSSVIAICGMGGIGKTTLAQCIYNLNKQHFQCSSFVEEIGKHYKRRVLGLQKQLLREVLEEKTITISSVSEGTRKIEEVLQNKKVLIVYDDIDDQDELSTLLGTKAFPTQSKIIITTRLLDIHAWFASISCRCSVHKLGFLNHIESLELLSWNAFGSKVPMKGFEKLAVQLVQYCGGNPLALKVLGSSLFVSNEDPSKINSMIEIWIDRWKSLNSSKGDLDCKIQDVLRKSFDSLQLRSHKELFLDIACFFVGESEDNVTILRDELYAEFGIMTLINRCLITVTPDTGKLMMNQLLQDMGRTIVCEESKHPAKHSRVWLDDESFHVLRKGDGSDSIEGLALDMRKVEEGMSLEALKTSSLVKMDKLRFLRLKYVNLIGSYENFPDLRWLCWHGCSLKTMPSGLSLRNLVAIDMSYGHMELFEVPKVISSLKILKLEVCKKLVSICNLHRLPKLETLMLQNCSCLSHLCKSIGDHKNLTNLYLTGCTKLWKASLSKKYVNQWERLKALYFGGYILEQPLLILPRSLIVLDLSCCNLGYSNDVNVGIHAQSLFNLFLWGNPFEYLPSNIDLKMLRILSLFSCPNLKSLRCMPSTLEEFYIDRCKSLERITFQSGRFSLQKFEYRGCFQLSEIEGLFKLVPIEIIDEVDLGHMKWIKAYQDHKVDLVGDEITEGRCYHIQMLYEYGIMSTYLQGIHDPNMMTYQYMSSCAVLSFCVPLHQKKHRILGLNVSCLYRSSSGQENKDEWVLLAKISNRTKGLTWIYNPVVYCKPRVVEDVVWLSYWPIGSVLEDRNEVCVDIIVDEGVLLVSQCGASLVYMDDGEVEEEKSENNTMIEEEVIGGDLSEFEVTTGAYYLCRRDLFGSQTSSWLKRLFGDNVHYPALQVWRKTRQSRMRSDTSCFVIVLKVSLISSDSEKRKILRAVSSLPAVECLATDVKERTLNIIGGDDPIAVISKLKKYVVEIASVKPIRRL